MTALSTAIAAPTPFAPRPTVPAKPASPARVGDAPFRLEGVSAYLIGIGGSGMSGLARMLASRGAIVSGSDRSASEATDALTHEGVAVGFDQNAGRLPERCDLIVASAAIAPTHPELAEARRRGIPTLSYAEALGRCMHGRTTACIAGTHGKSTTTAMLGTALVDAGLDPTVIVGATVGQLQEGSLQSEKRKVKSENEGGGEERPGVVTTHCRAATNAQCPVLSASGFRLGSDVIPAGDRRGQPGILVAESCEYNRSFHHYSPTVACITSVEADHLDTYGTLDAVVESFHEFARRIPSASAGGRLLIAHDGAHREAVTRGLACAVHTLGTGEGADWRVSYDPATRRVGLAHRGQAVAAWTASLSGRHNAMNAAAAFVLATWLGADQATVARSLAAFRGVDRRMQFMGEHRVSGGVVRVFDDYGHHPTEVAVTLRALREAERPESRGGRLICVFQPHQHSRTRHLLADFARSFSEADVVVVPEIYFVRDSEAERHAVSARDLVQRLQEQGVDAAHVDPFPNVVAHLAAIARAGDVIMTMGAGPVWEVARDYLAKS